MKELSCSNRLLVLKCFTFSDGQIASLPLVVVPKTRTVRQFRPFSKIESELEIYLPASHHKWRNPAFQPVNRLTSAPQNDLHRQPN